MEDAKIIQHFQNWETQYFSRLYDKYVDDIYRFIYAKTTDVQLAQDLVSEVFMSAFSRFWDCDMWKNKTLKPWIYTIARNKVIDYYKTQKTHSDIWDYLELSLQQDIAQDIDNTDKLQEILSYIQTLKPYQTDIMLLRIWDDLSYVEISQITGESESNCKKIVSRNLQKIAQLFQLFIIIIFFI